MSSRSAPSGESATPLRAVTALAASEVLARLAALVAVTLLARRLGPDGFGILGFALALNGFLVLFVHGGLNEIGAREVARAPDRAVDIYATVTAVRFLVAGLAIVVLAVVVGLLPKPPATQLVVLLTGLSLFSFAADPAWVLKGLERPALAGSGLVLSQGIFAVVVFVLVSGPDDVTAVPVMQFTGEFVAAALLVALLVGRTRPRASLRDGWAMLVSARYLTLTRLTRTAVASADVVLLGMFATDRAVGLYVAAYRVTFLMAAVIAAIFGAYLPLYTRVLSRGVEGAARQIVGRSMAVAVTIGAPLVMGAVVTARPILVLLFGATYAEAAPALRLLALGCGVVFVHWSHTAVFIATDRLRLQAAINGAAAACNVALNLVLIPRYGLTGAAVATLAAELLTAGLGLVVMRRLHLAPPVTPLLPPLAAASIMALIVWTASDTVPVLAQIGLGVVTYGVALAVMKFLTRRRAEGGAP